MIGLLLSHHLLLLRHVLLLLGHLLWAHLLLNHLLLCHLLLRRPLLLGHLLLLSHLLLLLSHLLLSHLMLVSNGLLLLTLVDRLLDDLVADSLHHMLLFALPSLDRAYKAGALGLWSLTLVSCHTDQGSPCHPSHLLLFSSTEVRRQLA